VFINARGVLSKILSIRKKKVKGDLNACSEPHMWQLIRQENCAKEKIRRSKHEQVLLFPNVSEMKLEGFSFLLNYQNWE